MKYDHALDPARTAPVTCATPACPDRQPAQHPRSLAGLYFLSFQLLEKLLLGGLLAGRLGDGGTHAFRVDAC